VGSLNFMRLSSKKGAHAILSRAAYRKFGASRSFFARCGIPQAFPSNLLRTPQLRTGALGSRVARVSYYAGSAAQTAGTLALMGVVSAEMLNQRVSDLDDYLTVAEALATTAHAAFSQRKPHELAQRHQPQQGIRDTWAENDGRSPTTAFRSRPTICSLGDLGHPHPKSGGCSFIFILRTRTLSQRWLRLNCAHS
jgi:hypothetical protein